MELRAIALGFVFLLPGLITPSCKSRETADKAPPVNEETSEPSSSKIGSDHAVPMGRAFSGAAQLSFALYYLPTPKSDPQDTLLHLITSRYSFLKVAKPQDNDTETSSLVRLSTPLIADFRPPDEESMQYFARGLSVEDRRAVQSTQQATLFEFQLSLGKTLSHHKRILELMSKLSEETGGLLWCIGSA